MLRKLRLMHKKLFLSKKTSCSYIRFDKRLTFHLFIYSRKRSLRDYVIKLYDSRIFKALLWIKKSFKCIDIKTHISLQRKSALKFAWKISNIKIKMSSLVTTFSSGTHNQQKGTDRGRNKHYWKSGYNTLEITDT